MKMAEPVYYLKKPASHKKPDDIVKQNIETMKKALEAVETDIASLQNTANALREAIRDLEQAPKGVLAGDYELVLSDEKIAKTPIRISKDYTVMRLGNNVLELKPDGLTNILLRHIVDASEKKMSVHQNILMNAFVEERPNTDGYDIYSVRNAMTRINNKTKKAFGIKLVSVKNSYLSVDYPIEKSK